MTAISTWAEREIWGYLAGRQDIAEGFAPVQVVGQLQEEALDTKRPGHSAHPPAPRSQTWNVGPAGTRM